jgi:transcriptional regulator of met regulon
MKDNQLDPNPPYGQRGAFRKITVTLPQGIYERLVKESARRKIAAEPNQLLSALLREAVVEYLERLDAFAWKNQIKDAR